MTRISPATRQIHVIHFFKHVHMAAPQPLSAA
jgi:hypothetical protein